jgi:acetyl esterase/lipase
MHRTLLLLALLVTPVFAQPAKAPAKAAPKPYVLPAGIKLEKDLAYIEGGDEAQKLDLYLPEKPSDKPLPLIVHIHGGGWRGGNKFPCPVTPMVLKGYVVASVEYRFTQKAVFPAQIQDCQAAIRWLRAHSKQYNFDPQRVGVIGGSAGGHLSALVGTSGGKKAFAPIGGNESQSDRVQAVCDIYGPADFTTVMQQAAEDKNVKNIFQFNTPGDPYSSLIGTRLDDAPNEQLAATLKAKGVAVWLQKLPGSGHGGPAFGKPAVQQLTQNFFDKHLKGADVKIELVPEAELAIEPLKPVAK